jgi:hypothetical protein
LVTGSTYQLSDDIKIKSISFPVDTQATINYVAELIEQEKNDNKEIQKYTYSSVNGQLFGTFDYKDDVYIKIWSKYYLKQKDYYQEMIELGAIRIEANENTVVYIKSSGNDNYVKYIINNTNLLSLENDETTIDAFYFGGVHLEET